MSIPTEYKIAQHPLQNENSTLTQLNLQISMSVLTILVILMLHVQTHLALSCVHVMKDSMELGSTAQVSYYLTN
jgi:hypothetical protein